MRTLLITEREVIPLLHMHEVMEAVETAFKEKGLGRGQMPPKSYLFYTEDNGDLRTMPSYLEELEISAVKIVNVHPDNPKKYKLPSVMATIALINPKTGIASVHPARQINQRIEEIYSDGRVRTSSGDVWKVKPSPSYEGAQFVTVS